MNPIWSPIPSKDTAKPILTKKNGTKSPYAIGSTLCSISSLNLVCAMAIPAKNVPIIPAIPRYSAKYAKLKQIINPALNVASVTLNLENNLNKFRNQPF